MRRGLWVGMLALVLALGAVDVAAQVVSWRLESRGALVMVLAVKLFLTAALAAAWAWKVRHPSAPSPPQVAEEAPKKESNGALLFAEADLRRFRHDLLSPINAASGFLELLEKGVAGELNPKQRMYVKNIRDSVNKLTALAQSLKRPAA